MTLTLKTCIHCDLTISFCLCLTVIALCKDDALICDDDGWFSFQNSLVDLMTRMNNSQPHFVRSVPCPHALCLRVFPSGTIGVAGWRGGSVGREENPTQVHIPCMIRVRAPSGAQENRNEVFRVKHVVLTRCRCAPSLVCRPIHTHKNDHVRTLKIM